MLYFRCYLLKAYQQTRFYSHSTKHNLAIYQSPISGWAFGASNALQSRIQPYNAAKANRSFSALPCTRQSISLDAAASQSKDDRIKTIDPKAYCQQAVRLSREAFKLHTFGVGGVLLDDEGRVHYCQHNNVLADECINDPTAHGERQIISWYLEQRKNGNSLPPPNQMTIVTSLDPCLMCTGAFLESGINVAVISHDDRAGIDWKFDVKFSGVPKTIRDQTLRQFAYLGLTNGKPFAGSPSSIFNRASIPAQLDQDSLSAFQDSLPIVQKILDGEDPEPVNIADLPPGSLQRQILRNVWPHAAALKLDIAKADDRGYLLGIMELEAERTKVSPQFRNAAALIDSFNNVLLMTGYAPNSTTDTVGIETPFMRLTRSYAKCRRIASKANDGCLPHPKRCKFVLLNGPGPNALDLMDLGAYGSTLEGPAHQGNEPSLSYFKPTQTPEALAAMIKAFPPLYSEIININPVHLKL